jgi:glycosyltransferase involved in cell wall biosynthesis
MFKLLAALRNIVRTYFVFYVFQNRLFRNLTFLKTFGLIYGLFHVKKILSMNRFLSLKESTCNARIVIENSSGNGGTSCAAQNFRFWLGKQSPAYTTEFYSELESKKVLLPKNENHSRQSEVFVIDSKIALVCIYLFKYREMRIYLFTWNHFDFSFYFSKFLSIRENVILVDYVARKECRYFDWNEELMFKDLERSDSIASLDRRNFEIHFIGRLTFQKGIDRYLQIADANTSIRFNVYGDGPLLKYIQQKMPANMYLHGFQNDPFKNISTKDFVIVPSRYFEGVPLVLLEAIHRNVPVISSGVGDLGLVSSNSHFIPGEGEDFFEYCNSLIKKNDF